MIMTQFGLTVIKMRLCYGLALAILITGNVQASNDENAERTAIEDENADVKRLRQITHIMRRNSFIDITLNRESFEEKCYVQPPNGQLTQTDIFAMEGVQVQHKSNFVSCRITIGPMIPDLLGNWELCGKPPVATTTEKMRCQPINIIWDAGNGNPVPSPSPLQRQIHRVHIGDFVNAGITEQREISTCHVVTPDGEDLVITPDVHYPHIETSTATPCSVIIKDITRDILGDWFIYGRFNQGIIGHRDTRLPFTLELYHDVNAYNIISLENQAHRVKVGSNITVEVTHSVGKVETCIYTSPSGLIFSSAGDTSTAPKGIQFRSVNDYGVCGINFDPVTEDMFGEWQIIGRFRNVEVIDEKRLTFNISEKAFDEDDINMLDQINQFTLQDASVDISLNKESFEEECYLRPPNGEFTRADLIIMEGVKVQKKSNFVSCRVTIGPDAEDRFGIWTLCGKSLLSEEVRCQPASIALRTGNWDIRYRAQFTHPVHFGGSVNSGVSEGGTVETCHVVTPAGEDLLLTTDVNYPHIKRVNIANVCNVVIENITEDMLGAWLIYGTFHSVIGRTESRLPLVFNLFDKNNPYAQAYNVTVLQYQNHLVHVGTNLSLVLQRTGDRQDCIYRAPSGETFSINDNNSVEPRGVHFSTLNTAPVCQIAFNPITEEAVGEWQISLRYRNGVLFNEIRQTFRIIEEDPENPLQENVVRNVQYLTTQNINTKMNTSHRFIINSVSTIESESCHIIAPDGRQYAFIDGFNVPNVEIINEDFVECGITLHVVEENMIGTWTILGRATSFSNSIERRLPVTIRVEENFVLQNDMHIREGSDLYLHLNEAITLPETCTLIGPDGNEITNVEFDPIYASACGYIIRDVNQTHNGTWIIEYGARIKKRGSVNVEVLDPTTLSLDNLQWSIGDSVDISVGPENAVYCVIKDVSGNIVFDDFGQCKIVLDRVSVHHRGNWTMQIGKPGTVRLQSYNFYVEVHSIDGLPIVSTTVEENLTSLMLTCSVPARHEVHACKFRDPRGNILIAAHGVGQDNYMFKQATVNYVSNAHSHDCTLRLINPSVAELGIWRCGLDTSTGTHYGFLTVVLPQNPGTASPVVTEPILRSTDVSYFEGDPVTLSCSISSALRYCYFRARNGTIYNVFPRMSRSENFEYVGAGLDAGDCGIRFNSLSTREGGQWSCHVGLLDTTAPELRAEIEATITAKMTVNHFWDRQLRAVVEAFVHNGQAIEYCRFVRMNGEGFTSDNVPSRYTLEPLLHVGSCILNIWNPDPVDLQPWTIAVKLVEGSGEITMTTVNNQSGLRTSRSIFSGALFWLTIVFVCILIFSVAGACFPKKNRDWTYRRASGLNQSVRSYFNKNLEKKPPKTEPQHA